MSDHPPVPPSLHSLPPSLQAGFLHFLHRLELLHCPFIGQLRGDNEAVSIDLFAQKAGTIRTGSSHYIESTPVIDLRLALLTWMIER
jgi:hypothetical protein